MRSLPVAKLHQCSTLLAGDIGQDTEDPLPTFDALRKSPHLFGEGAIEFVQSIDTGQNSFFNLIEILLHVSGELGLHRILEVFSQEIDHLLPEEGRVETPVLFHDIASILDDRDNGGVGARPPDPFLLQQVHQSRLAVPPGGLGELLTRLHLLQEDLFSFFQVGWERLLLRLLIGKQGEKPIKDQRAPARFQGVGTRLQDRLSLQVDGWEHLRREETPVDQCVELPLIRRERRGDRLWYPPHIGRTDCLVSILGSFLVLEVAHLGSEVLLSVLLDDHLACFRHCLIGGPQ